MKEILLTAVVVTSMAYQTCGKKAVDSVPSCIRARIDEIKKQPRWNPPAQVDEYRYNGRRVFLFSSNCCDQFNQLVGEDCNYICAPSGGFTGKGDGRCRDFSDKAQLVRTVWKDDRKQ